MNNQMELWLADNYWLIEILFILSLTVAAYVVWNKIQRMVRRKSVQTDTPLDNIIIEGLSLPLSLMIVFIGIYQAIDSIGDSFIQQYTAGHEGIFYALRQVVILVTVFWVILRVINKTELHYRRRTIKIGEQQVNPGTLYATFQTLRGIIFVIALLTVMEAFDVSISGLLAFGGVGSIIIGFAAKDTLGNFFSGMLIFWERPFVQGDWIRCPTANIEGVVENIGWRMTQIRTFDQRPVYVPNSLFFNSVIENPQRMTNRRIYEYIGIRYDDIDKMPQLLESIRTMIRNHEGIEPGKIQMVNFDRYGSSSLDFFIYAMTKTIDWDQFQHVKEDVLLQIAKIVREHGCEFAFPTRTIHYAAADMPPAISM